MAVPPKLMTKCLARTFHRDCVIRNSSSLPFRVTHVVVIMLSPRCKNRGLSDRDVQRFVCSFVHMAHCRHKHAAVVTATVSASDRRNNDCTVYRRVYGVYLNILQFT